jgi:hypothetical protein
MTKTDRQGVLVDWLVYCYTPFGGKRLRLELLDGLDTSGDQFGGGEASHTGHRKMKGIERLREPSLGSKTDKDGNQTSQNGLDG